MLIRAFTCPHLQAKLFPGGARGRQVTRVVEGTLVEWVSGNMLVARHARHLHHDEYTEFLHWPALGGAGAHQKFCVLAVFGDCVSYVFDDDAG